MTTPPHDGDLPGDPPGDPFGDPFAGPPDGPTPAGPRRRRVIVVTAVAVGVLVVAGAVVGTLVARSHSDEARIRTLVSTFAVVVDDEDQDGILALMCTEEAADITGDDDYDPSRPPPVDPPPHRPVRVSDVRVDGEVASAHITRPDQPGATLWFRKEDGRWTVCAHAQDDVAAGSSVSSTP